MSTRTSVIRRLAGLRHWSRDEWRVRLTQKAHAFGERARLALGAPPCGQRLSAVPRAALNASARLAFDPLRGDASQPQIVARELAARDPTGFAALRLRVDRLHVGRASLLGVGEVLIGVPPDWHREGIAGKSAPLHHWSRIQHLDTALVGDHKVLWEVNRHQYLLGVALRWLVDGEAQDFALVQQHLESWLERNPVKRGINWASSLEVAYRAISWCWLLWLLRSAPWRETLLVRVLECLEAHGLHIERYLSTYYSPNTHLTGEALGLVYIGTALPWSANAGRFIACGSKVLDDQIESQVTPDGVYFEQATQYQRYTAEIYLHHLLLARVSGRSIAGSVGERLYGLMDVLRTIVSGSARMPLIGDDDGGLLLPIDGLPPDDLRGLLLLAGVALDRPELVASGDVAPALSYMLCGRAATEQLLSAPSTEPAWSDMYFSDGGVAVLRNGWGETATVAVIDASPHGALSCGHAHADALSMTLSLRGLALFVDRGTFTYCGADRDEFRTTKAHNTLEIDGQSAVTPEGPFKWGAIPPRAVGRMGVGPAIKVFDGVATGHAGSDRPSTHRRVVLHVVNGSWVVFDIGERAAAKSATVRWQLAPGLRAARIGDHQVDILGIGGRVVARVMAPISGHLDVRPRDVSLRYGHRVAAEVLEAMTDSRLRSLSVIAPADATFADPARQVGAVDGCLASRWSDCSGRHELLCGTGQRARADMGGCELFGDLIWRIATGSGLHAVAVGYDLVMAVNADARGPAWDGSGGDSGAIVPVLCAQRRSDGTWTRVALCHPVRGEA